MQIELRRVRSRHRSEAHDPLKLSPEELLEHYRRCRNGGDRRARNYLVQALKRYAIVIALKYCHYGPSLSALIAEGELGIVHAITVFDPEHGHRFLTCVAYWIRAYILESVIHSLSARGADSPTSSSNLLFRLRREKVRITNALGKGTDTVEFFAEPLDKRQPEVASATSANSLRLAADAAQ